MSVFTYTHAYSIHVIVSTCIFKRFSFVDTVKVTIVVFWNYLKNTDFLTSPNLMFNLQNIFQLLQRVRLVTW